MCVFPGGEGASRLARVAGHWGTLALLRKAAAMEPCAGDCDSQRYPSFPYGPGAENLFSTVVSPAALRPQPLLLALGSVFCPCFAFPVNSSLPLLLYLISDFSLTRTPFSLMSSACSKADCRSLFFYSSPCIVVYVPTRVFGLLHQRDISLGIWLLSEFIACAFVSKKTFGPNNGSCVTGDIT